MSDTATVEDHGTEEHTESPVVVPYVEDDTPAEVPQEGTETPETTEDTEENSESVDAVSQAAADEIEAAYTSRRSRNQLEMDVKFVTDQYAEGVLPLPEGKLLTPHRIAAFLRDRDDLPKAPSTGAISDVLKRWEEVGFAEINQGPKAFLRYTDAGLDEGLATLKGRRQDRLKAERKQNRAQVDAAENGGNDETEQPPTV